MMIRQVEHYNRNRRRLKRTRTRRTLLTMTLIYLTMMMPQSISSSSLQDENAQNNASSVQNSSYSSSSSTYNLSSTAMMNQEGSNMLHSPLYYHHQDGDKDTISEKQSRSNLNLRALYEGIPPEVAFHGKNCSINKHCYNLFGRSLECKKGTCQCIVWKGIQLRWKANSSSCLGAGGHPCVTKKMCYSENCDKSKGRCVSAAFRKDVGRFGVVEEIVIQISVVIFARLVLPMGV